MSERKSGTSEILDEQERRVLRTDPNGDITILRVPLTHHLAWLLTGYVGGMVVLHARVLTLPAPPIAFLLVCLAIVVAVVMARRWALGRVVLSGHLLTMTTLPPRTVDVRKVKLARMVRPVGSTDPVLVVVDRRGHSLLRAAVGARAGSRDPLHTLLLHGGVTVLDDLENPQQVDIDEVHPWAPEVELCHRNVV